MLGLYDGRYDNARAVLMPVASWLSVMRTASAASRWRVAWLANGHVTDHQPHQPNYFVVMSRHHGRHARYWSVGNLI